MKILLLVPLLIALALPAGAQVPSAQKTANPSQTKTNTAPALPPNFILDATGRLKEKGTGLSLLPPPGWQLSTVMIQRFPTPGQPVMTLIGPQKNGYQANLNIHYLQGDPGHPLPTLGEHIQTKISKQIPGWKEGEKGSLKLANKDAYSYSSGFPMGPIKVRNIQYFVRGNHKKMYVLTFTCLEQDYAALKPLFLKHAQSLQVP